MLTLLALSLALTAQPQPRQLVDRIVAVVNDDVILKSELDDAVEKMTAAFGNRKPDLTQVLESLIAERLMLQQLAEAKIEVDDDQVSRAIQDILRQNKLTEAELQTAIESRGMSMNQYREDVRAQLVRLKLIDMKVRSRVVIPEAEIKAEFERRTRDDAREELVRIRHIFLRWGESPDPTERDRVLAAAQAAKQRVEAGEAFEAVAKEISQGPTASTGGDLGEMSVDGMLPELARGIKGLPPGEITDPIETGSGVHVVQVENRRQKSGQSYEQARTPIYNEMYQREVEAQMKVWLEELRDQAAVTVIK